MENSSSTAVRLPGSDTVEIRPGESGDWFTVRPEAGLADWPGSVPAWFTLRAGAEAGVRICDGGAGEEVAPWAVAAAVVSTVWIGSTDRCAPVASSVSRRS
ncbi:hypothetical protein ABZZ20_36030 [Streptomyces sp. NPDC006430]|uniref:hypothetical protein n=1 Tax=Streptomyces sp. NPDC006430 TaxID=3154299 RepID=UPI0033BA6902